MTGRTEFTSDDDALLTKYIARYNPGVQGRSGNKLYQVLTANAENKWGWSARHPWSAWRERYRNNVDWFNRKIKKYQEKHGMPMENEGRVNGARAVEEGEDAPPTRKRKRNPDVDSRKRARREEEEEESDEEARKRVRPQDEEPPPQEDSKQPASRPRRTHVPDIYPDIATLDVSPAESSSSSSSKSQGGTSPPPRPPRSKAKTKVIPPSSSSPAHIATTIAEEDNDAGTSKGKDKDEGKSKPKPKGRPFPKIVEGAFGTAFVGARRPITLDSSDEDEGGNGKKKDTAQWPPVRKRNATQPKPVASKPKPNPQPQQSSADEMDEVDKAITRQPPEEEEMVPADVAEPEPERSPSPPPPPLPPRPVSPPLRANAVASSSRVQLSPHPARRKSPSPTAAGKRLVVGAPSAQKSSAEQWLSTLRGWSASSKDGGSHVSAQFEDARETSPDKRRRRSPTPPAAVSKAASFRPRERGRDPDEDSDSIPVSHAQIPRKSSPSKSFVKGNNGYAFTLPGRRSRAPSPGSVVNLSLPTPVQRFQLPSPPRAGARPATESFAGTPLAGKGKAPAKPRQLDNLRRSASHNTHPRRHSVPLPVPLEEGSSQVLPRIDFNARMITVSAPLRTPVVRSAELTRRAPVPARYSLPAPAPAGVPSSSPSRARLASVPVPVSGEQQQLAALAKKYDQSVEVVRDVLKSVNGAVEAAERVLGRMREAAVRAKLEAFTELRKEAEEVMRERKRSLGVQPPSGSHARAATKERERERRTNGKFTADVIPQSRRDADKESRHRQRESGGMEEAEEPFVLHHRRERGPESSQQKKAKARAEEETFRPQPLARGVFTDIGYSPPSSSRARVAQKLKRRERERGQTSTGAQVQAQAPTRAGQEELPDFKELAANPQVLRMLERRDHLGAVRLVVDIADFMAEGRIPPS